MAETGGSGRRRGGSHFASPGDQRPSIDWGSRDDAWEEPARRDPVQGPSWDQDEASYTAAFELEDLLDGPSPRDVPASATGSFRRISAGQGARFTTRDTAAADIRHDATHARLADGRRPRAASRARGVSPARIAIPVLVALLVAAVALFLLRGAVFPGADGGAEAPQDHVDVGEVLTFDGYDYCVSQGDDGGYSFERVTGQEPLSLVDLPGTPIGLLFYNGTFYMPENLEDGTWDVMCYTLGDGSIGTPYMGEDGEPIGGEGELASASIEGDQLVVATDAGEETALQLM